MHPVKTSMTVTTLYDSLKKIVRARIAFWIILAAWKTIIAINLLFLKWNLQTAIDATVEIKTF